MLFGHREIVLYGRWEISNFPTLVTKFGVGKYLLVRDNEIWSILYFADALSVGKHLARVLILVHAFDQAEMLPPKILGKNVQVIQTIPASGNYF